MINNNIFNFKNINLFLFYSYLFFTLFSPYGFYNKFFFILIIFFYLIYFFLYNQKIYLRIYIPIFVIILIQSYAFLIVLIISEPSEITYQYYLSSFILFLLAPALLFKVELDKIIINLSFLLSIFIIVTFLVLYHSQFM
jgi:hypothetical protein